MLRGNRRLLVRGILVNQAVIKLTSPMHGWHFLVHQSTRETGRWQLTRFESNEPTGHTTYNSAGQAMASAQGIRVAGEIPVGDHTFRVHGGDPLIRALGNP